MLHEYHVIHSVRYYPRFRVTAVGHGTYYPRIQAHYCIFYYYLRWYFVVKSCKHKMLYTVCDCLRGDVALDIDHFMQCTVGLQGAMATTGYTRQARTYVTQERSRNHCCHEKAISITYSECGFVVLVIRHVMRMRRVKFPSAACLAIPYLKKAQFSGKSHWT
jgi:hypothetical protein